MPSGTKSLNRASPSFPVTCLFCAQWYTIPHQSVSTLPYCLSLLCPLVHNPSTERLNTSLLPITFVPNGWLSLHNMYLPFPCIWYRSRFCLVAHEASEELSCPSLLAAAARAHFKDCKAYLISTFLFQLYVSSWCLVLSLFFSFAARVIASLQFSTLIFYGSTWLIRFHHLRINSLLNCFLSAFSSSSSALKHFWNASTAVLFPFFIFLDLHILLFIIYLRGICLWYLDRKTHCFFI